MIETITRTLKAKKYGLPSVGTFTGQQLAEMLRQGNAPAETIQVFEKFVGSVKFDIPKTIIIDVWQ